MGWFKNSRRLWAFILVAFAGYTQVFARSQVNTCLDVTQNTGNFMLVNAPVLQYTITSFDPSWFTTEDAQAAPTLFTIQFVMPGLSNAAGSEIGNLRLRVLVQADTSRGHGLEKDWVTAFDKQSNTLTSTQLNTVLRSNDIFSMPYEPGGVSFDKSDLFDIVVAQQKTPEMNLHFKFSLNCENNNAVLSNDLLLQVVNPVTMPIGKLRFVHTVQAISPGTQIQNSKPVSIYTLSPLFKIASELFNNVDFQYPTGDPKMEVFIYEVEDGESAKDAMDGIEFAKFPIFNQSPAVYPPELPMLTPGKTYAWRARAILRGPASEYLYSNALYFKVDDRLNGNISPPYPELSETKSIENQIKYADDYAKRVMAALKIILAENFEAFDLTRVNKIPVKGQIRLNGHPYSLEELERLAKEFQLSKHSISRLRLQ